MTSGTSTASPKAAESDAKRRVTGDLPAPRVERGARMLFGVRNPVSGALLGPSGHVQTFSPRPHREREREGFRWEAEMTALVAGQVQRLMPRGGAHLVIGELPAAQGIADIVAVRFDVEAVGRRLASGVRPVTSPLRVRVLHLLREDRVLLISTLAARLGTNAQALTRSTLGPLADLGLVELTPDAIRSTGAWRPAAAHVTAVELKLAKWRDALRQADNFAISADRAWLVLDASKAAAAVRESAFIAGFGVGLAVVEPMGDLRVIAAPRGRRPERWLRALMAEQAWASAELEVAAAFGGVRLHQRTPALEMPRIDARSVVRREAVAERDRLVEPVRDETATLSNGYSGKRGGLFSRVAELVAFSEREVVRSAHLGALGTGTRLVLKLIDQMLVNAPLHVAHELRLEVREGGSLGLSHRCWEPVNPRSCRHATAEAPGTPAHSEPAEPT